MRTTKKGVKFVASKNHVPIGSKRKTLALVSKRKRLKPGTSFVLSFDVERKGKTYHLKTTVNVTRQESSLKTLKIGGVDANAKFLEKGRTGGRIRARGGRPA